MAKCYVCGGWKEDFGSCVTCDNRNIQERQNRKLVDSIEESGRTQAKIAAIQAIYQAEQAEEQHKELVELEKKKLREQIKQTQILLEQTLTVEEVFQRGFNFEIENDEHDDAQVVDVNTGEDLTPDHLNYVAVDLSEEGTIVPNFDNPYLQGKFKKAYQDGIESKIRQDYPQGPGFEYVSECAFNAGYARDEYPSIFFPKIVNKKISHIEHGGSKYSFILAFQNKPNFKEAVDGHTGRLSYTWTPPYETDLLNLSFEAGVNNCIEEQNTEKLKEERLAKIREQQSLALKKLKEERLAKIREQQSLALKIEKEQRDAEARKKIAEKSSGVFKAVIFSTLMGGIWGAVLSIPIWFTSHLFFSATWTLVGIIEASAAIAALIGLVLSFCWSVLGKLLRC